MEPMRYGMVGGGSGAFFGAVHRRAAALTGELALVAGALSSTPEKSIASGVEIGLADDRSYPDWQTMLDAEQSRSEGDQIDFVTIVTPNHTHHPIAKAFLEAGFDVVLDKPMAITVEEADDLVRTAEGADRVLCVTYTFVGYPMVREARRIVRSGEIGDVRKIYVDFRQGWLATAVEQTGNKQASWRTDPKLAGAGALGDIGVHAEMLARWVSGLTPTELCAEVSTLVGGRLADDDASVLLRYDTGARGVLNASQVCAGEECAIELRVFGERGGVVWSHEDANRLRVLSADDGERVVTRAGALASEDSNRAAFLPSGHEEGFHEALANVYRGAIAAMRARRAGEAAGGLGADYPNARDGALGVRFVRGALASARAEGAWIGLA